MIRQQQLGLQCKRHSQNDILYVKVNNIKDGEDIFFCEECPFTQSNFCIEDCAMIKQIFTWNHDSIIKNFFPFINEASFFKKFKNVFNQNNSMLNQINLFYEELEKRLIQIVANAKKSAYNLAEQMQNLSTNAVEVYSQILKISEIKNMLSDLNINQDQKESNLRSLFQQIILDAQQNTQKFSNILDKYQQLQTDFYLTQSSLLNSQLINVINQNEYTNKFQLLFPPKIIDLLDQLEFDNITSINDNQQIGRLDIIKNNNQVNRVVKGDNKYIQFVMPKEQNFTQFCSKTTLNKSSEYSLKFKIKDFKNCIKKLFSIELFSYKNPHNSFVLNCNLDNQEENEFNSNNKIDMKLNQRFSEEQLDKFELKPQPKDNNDSDSILKSIRMQNQYLNQENNQNYMNKALIRQNNPIQINQTILNTLNNEILDYKSKLKSQVFIEQSQISSIEPNNNTNLNCIFFEQNPLNSMNQASIKVIPQKINQAVKNAQMSKRIDPQSNSNNKMLMEQYSLYVEELESFNNNVMDYSMYDESFQNCMTQSSIKIIPQLINQEQQINNQKNYQHDSQMLYESYISYFINDDDNDANMAQNSQQQKEIEIQVLIQISEGIFQATYFTNQNNLLTLSKQEQRDLINSQDLQIKISFNGDKDSELILTEAVEKII
ncbi:hypothetical protein TTHERM_00519840 (macronuclear) [Tetrahymena thermophila SB210]|uniref:Uncharacterized protein n=1 Tax=Tetrahymena thermophila (strain SB210) TaxID=312017 RepID=I7LUN8_TETTS|nr:hypothetical protein TTHERM_00519840 [Tetrahymena thermophila SB210]EAR95053.1 hypothetical protein TTHERM_00519840 [Tetrahymena thermophila SB210]|eukprot:XP_001015298.1 hypothetical protein TTHERM_00519840 [Tetrahymena thermophila SB210]